MNIALYHNLPSGGARRAMVEMVKGLVARGHTVDEYCLQTADLSFLPLNGTVRRTVVLPFQPLGAAKTRVPMLTPYITAARRTRDLQNIAAVGQRAAQHIDRQNYDIVFTHDCQLVLVPDALRYLQQPGVHYFHVGARAFETGQASRYSRSGLMDWLKSAYYAPARRVYPRLRYRQAQANLCAARQVLTNSNFARDELQGFFDAASQVCYLGVDVTRFRPLGLSREAFVLSVGAVHYHKGYRFLIQGLAKLPDGQRPPLVIAANSAEPAELQVLQALATELRVNLTVRNVSDEAEMATLYNRAAAFVYCPIREPWGLAAVEAMACGTAVVGVGEGGVAESLVDGETALLTNRDVEAFADALGRVLSDPALAERLGAGGVTRVRAHFTWTGTVDQLEAHFQDIVKVGAPL
jgi:glycosyltransferase involved in cell wall biosynthesis